MKKIFFIMICAMLFQLSAFAQFDAWRPTESDPNYYYQRDNGDSLLATMFVFAGSLPNEVAVDTIANGQTTSTIVDTKNKKISAVIFPATFTGATVSILTSDDTTSATFMPLEYDGSLVTITATDGRQCAPQPVKVMSTLRYVKYVSASSEAALRVVKTILTTF